MIVVDHFEELCWNFIVFKHGAILVDYFWFHSIKKKQPNTSILRACVRTVRRRDYHLKLPTNKTFFCWNGYFHAFCQFFPFWWHVIRLQWKTAVTQRTRTHEFLRNQLLTRTSIPNKNRTPLHWNRNRKKRVFELICIAKFSRWNDHWTTNESNIFPHTYFACMQSTLKRIPFSIVNKFDQE